MVLNYIWIAFFLLAFVVALFRIMGYVFRDYFAQHLGWIFDAADKQVFSAMVQSTFDMASSSVNIAIYLIGVMTLWLGIMRIGEKGGAIQGLSRLIGPFFNRIFPDLPKNHPVMGSILMNFSANMLGLDNAATPLGLKAMKELQELNPDKERASNAQIMFLVLNASGLTIIPVSIMAMRASYGAANPADIFIPILITTFFSTLTGLLTVALIQRINLFNRVILAYLGGVSLLVAGLIYGLTRLAQPQVESVSTFGGHFILISFIIAFILLGVRKKINLYETFIDGAGDGFKTAVGIIPYLVAMLVGIGVFRASGALDIIVNGLGKGIALLGVNTDFVGALPTALMKPLSGSGARGMMLEAFQHYGVDSFQARLAATFQGSTETTFYILAVYYGAVGVRNTRYTVGCGLLSELAAIIAGTVVAYLFFY